MRLRVGSARAVSLSRILGAAILSVYPDGMVVCAGDGVKAEWWRAARSAAVGSAALRAARWGASGLRPSLLGAGLKARDDAVRSLKFPRRRRSRREGTVRCPKLPTRERRARPPHRARGPRVRAGLLLSPPALLLPTSRSNEATDYSESRPAAAEGTSGCPCPDHTADSTACSFPRPAIQSGCIG